MGRVKPRIDPALAYLAVDGEAIAYDPRTGKLHFLNHTAAVVLGLADGTETIEQISQEIADAYRQPVDQVEPVVRTTIRELRKVNLLEPARRVQVAEVDGADDKPLVLRHQVPPSI
jgi:PqqD family protein of HPr-rel-A system